MPFWRSWYASGELSTRSRHRTTLAFVECEAHSKSYGGMGSQIASKNAEMQCITCLDAVLPGTNELSRSVKTCSEKSRARILEERAKLERTSKALTDSSSSLSAWFFTLITPDARWEGDTIFSIELHADSRTRQAKSLLGGDEGVKDGGGSRKRTIAPRRDSDKQISIDRACNASTLSEEMVDIFEAKIVFFCSTERFKRSMCGEINRINTPLTTSYLTVSLAQNTHIVRSTLAKPSTQARDNSSSCCFEASFSGAPITKVGILSIASVASCIISTIVSVWRWAIFVSSLPQTSRKATEAARQDFFRDIASKENRNVLKIRSPGVVTCFITVTGKYVSISLHDISITRGWETNNASLFAMDVNICIKNCTTCALAAEMSSFMPYFAAIKVKSATSTTLDWWFPFWWNKFETIVRYFSPPKAPWHVSNASVNTCSRSFALSSSSADSSEKSFSFNAECFRDALAMQQTLNNLSKSWSLHASMRSFFFTVLIIKQKSPNGSTVSFGNASAKVHTNSIAWCCTLLFASSFMCSVNVRTSRSTRATNTCKTLEATVQLVKHGLFSQTVA